MTVDKNILQLKQTLEEEKRNLLNLRFKNKVGQLTETHLLKNSRKKISKILTELNQLS